MKHAAIAAIVLALGAGLAVAAQANTTSLQGHSAMPQRQAALHGQMRSATPAHLRLSRQQIRQAQRHRAAMARLQRGNLHRTASLHGKTLNRQTGSQAVGVGSSTPGTQTTPATGTAVTPPATNPTPPSSAGGSTGTSDQKTNR